MADEGLFTVTFGHHNHIIFEGTLGGQHTTIPVAIGEFDYKNLKAQAAISEKKKKKNSTVLDIENQTEYEKLYWEYVNFSGTGNPYLDWVEAQERLERMREIVTLDTTFVPIKKEKVKDDNHVSTRMVIILLLCCVIPVLAHFI